MRHFLLTTSILTGLMLSACAKEAPSKADVLTASEIVSKPLETPPQKTQAAEGQSKSALKPHANQSDPSTLLKRYQGLDPQDMSWTEIEEHIALQKEQAKQNKKNRDLLKAWQQQDPASRGPRPRWKTSELLSEADRKRFRVLESKLRMGTLRKNYEVYIPKTLSRDEVNELVTLQQAQVAFQLEQEEKSRNWMEQDPAQRRGRSPSLSSLGPTANNPRLLELQGKIQAESKMQRLTQRIENLSATHNISLSDSEISELTALKAEETQFANAVNIAMIEAQKESQAGGKSVSQSDLMSKIPKHIVQRMMDVQFRVQAIEGPLKAAENADRVEQRLMQLSQSSGVSILSSEINEAIALNAEKDKIQTRTQFEAARKWLAEGGTLLDSLPLPNDVDYARLKEIEARLEEISTPMNEAKYAVQDAKNPALRQQRLRQAEQKKWNTVWQDKKQAGEIPADARLNSPSYAELQDRVENYDQKLKSRADKAGYVIPEADVENLTALNEKMLSIRKTVYDMEADGASVTWGKASPFKITAGMYKVRLIENKQREILSGLSETESLQNEATSVQNSETGTQTFNRRDFGEVLGPQTGAKAMIERLRASGVEISQADADELIAFEQELESQ